MNILRIFKGVSVAPIPSGRDLFSQLFEGTPNDEVLSRPWLRAGEKFLWTSKSSVSLALIAQLRMELTKKSQIRVWVPEYFCNDSLNQLRKISPDLIFYPMDFFLPSEKMHGELNTSTLPDIIIYVHYFGEPANLHNVTNFCKKTGAWLIEDAAHCFERSKGVGELGFGDFILFSQHKHLPLPDGALLIFNGSGVSKIEAKEAAFSHIIVIFNQLPKFNFKQKIFLFFWIFKRLLQIFGIPLSINEVEKEGVINIPTSYDQYPSMSCLSKKLLIKLIPKLEEFKSNKLQLLDEWNEIIKCFGGKPLFNGHKKSFIPYMAAFDFNSRDDARGVYRNLKLKNFPVLTWPDLPKEISDVNEKKSISILYYETRLFFPITPSLKKSNLLAYKKFSAEYISKDWSLRKISFDEWEFAIKNALDLNFLQSWRYGEAKRASSRWVPERYVIEDINGNALSIVQASVFHLIFGYKVVHINRGPILLFGEFQESELMRKIACIDLLGAYSSKNKWLLLKLIPEIQGLENIGILASMGFFQISKNYWGSARLSLKLSDEDILAGFTSKWRGHLRKSIKNDVQIKRSDLSGENIDILQMLYGDLINTKNFEGINSKLIKSLTDENFVLYFAYKDKQILGALVTLKSGNTCTYFIGVTNKLGRELQANSLLLWSSILDAKSCGCLFFDVGGLDEKTPQGIASFKKGLNGLPYTLIGGWIKLNIFNVKK